MNLTDSQLQALKEIPFQAMVGQLAKPGADILATLTPDNFRRLQGFCEAMVWGGDRLDAIKKVVIYNKPEELAQAPKSRHPDELIAGFAALTPEKAHLLHMALGLAGEAAEMLDQVMNHAFYDEPLDVKNVIEEGGDALFYIEGIAQGVNTTTVVMEEENKAKLLTGEKARYKLGVYSDAQAQARADKVEA